LISGLIDRNVALISCDDLHLPIGLMLPLDGNHVQTERFRIQIAATELMLKNL
jgi:CRISPR-associated protein Cas1